jgi:hypothetical protein
MNALLVNCDHWSVLNISGFCQLTIGLANAFSSALTQKSDSSVLDSSHDSTHLEYQSITATRYMNHQFILM